MRLHIAGVIRSLGVVLAMTKLPRGPDLPQECFVGRRSLPLRADLGPPRRNGCRRMTVIPPILSRPLRAALAAFAATLSGCAALHPVNGIPIDRVDPCLLQPDRPRSDQRTIDLSLLGQGRPMSHVVDAGDVLGIYIEGVLGDEAQGPPVVSPSLGATPGALTTATVASASLGYPVAVRDDGTISLPYKPPFSVRGLTMGEVELRIREIYSGPDGLLKPGRDRIFLTLHKPRTVRVMVVRKDRPLEPAYLQPPDYRRADDGRGTAVLVELPAYENDVLHALVASGGLPGPDAENAVYVMRAGGACNACANSPYGPSWQPTMPGHATQHGVTSPMLPAAPPARFPMDGFSAARPIEAAGSAEIELASARVLAAMPIPADVTPANSRAYFGHAAMQPFASRTNYGAATATSNPWSRPQISLPVGHTASPGHAFSAPAAPNPSSIEPTGFCLAERGRKAHTCSPSLPCSYEDATVHGPAVRKIPLTILPGESPSFCRSDVLLSNGDVVFVESRSQEYFYTAGLLGGGKYPLPRNEDTSLLDAIALADSQNRILPTRQVGGVSSLSQDVTVGASRVVIFRNSGSGQQVPIKVDLNRVKRNPSLAPSILPGDRIVLQYTPLQAIGATIERHLLEGAVLGVASAVSIGNN